MKKRFAYTTLLGLFLAACSSDDSSFGTTTPIFFGKDEFFGWSKLFGQYEVFLQQRS